MIRNPVKARARGDVIQQNERARCRTNVRRSRMHVRSKGIVVAASPDVIVDQRRSSGRSTVFFGAIVQLGPEGFVEDWRRNSRHGAECSRGQPIQAVGVCRQLFSEINQKWSAIYTHGLPGLGGRCRVSHCLVFMHSVWHWAVRAPQFRKG